MYCRKTDCIIATTYQIVSVSLCHTVSASVWRCLHQCGGYLACPHFIFCSGLFSHHSSVCKSHTQYLTHQHNTHFLYLPDTLNWSHILHDQVTASHNTHAYNILSFSLSFSCCRGLLVVILLVLCLCFHMASVMYLHITHVQVTGFQVLWGLSIVIMIFILYKLYFLSPTPKPIPHSKLSAFLDFQKR